MKPLRAQYMHTHTYMHVIHAHIHASTRVRKPGSDLLPINSVHPQTVEEEQVAPHLKEGTEGQRVLPSK